MYDSYDIPEQPSTTIPVTNDAVQTEGAGHRSGQKQLKY